MKKASLFLLVTLITALSGFFALPVAAAPELVKSALTKTVYYLDSAGTRHPFPNSTTYQSWYGNDFSKIIVVSNEFLSQFPLGRNITIRPGTYLVKLVTSPIVYAVEPGGVLREIKTEQIAIDIYGQNWARRVVDLPDVFFSNYQLGEKIVHYYPVPEGSLYQDKKTSSYFYKFKESLRPLAAAALAANNLDTRFAIVSDAGYNELRRPITGRSQIVFNPAAAPFVSKRDCEVQNLRAAFILLTNTEPSASQREAVKKVLDATAERYAWATDGLSGISLDSEIVSFIDDGYFLRSVGNGTFDIETELINTFYETHDDVYDFVFIWTNFDVPKLYQNETAHFVPVTNAVVGNGRQGYDVSPVYGSAGKLKGIIVMGNVNQYETTTVSGMNAALNIVLHEILHQWSAYAKLIDGSGNPSTILLKDNGHWTYYAGFYSPVGGSGFTSNGDGTFTSALSQLADPNLRPYSKLDLYLMGLIPARYVTDTFTFIVPETPQTTGNTIAGTAYGVTVDDIIAANGPIRCIEEY